MEEMRKLFEFIKRTILKIFRVIFSVERSTETHTYHYQHKDFLVTYTENDFFKILVGVVGEKYYVFPQIHLSSIVDHKVPNGQSWKGALSKIDRKSVDYVLCEKDHLRPVLAIELDDKTHDRADRAARDEFVERVLEEAKVPLVRLRDYNILSEGDVRQKILEALNT